MEIGTYGAWIATAMQFFAAGAMMQWPDRKWIAWGLMGIGVLIAAGTNGVFFVSNYPDLYSSVKITWFLIPSGVGIGLGLAWILLKFYPIGGIQLFSRRKTPFLTLAEFDDIQSLYNSWILPSAQAGNQVLQRVIHAMRKHANSAVRSHEALIQRSIIDEERAALSRLSNALRRIDPTNLEDLQDRVGNYYRVYQAMRTWIAQGIKLTSIELKNDAIFQEWLRLDEKFLDRLRQFSGRPRYGRLRKLIDLVGWGENVTRDLRGSK